MTRRKLKAWPNIMRRGRKGKKLPQSIYDSRPGVSKTERDLEYEQAQSMRWLKQHAQGNQSIAAATQSELQALFKCRTIEQIEARPELTVESKAILEILETERGRSRIVQGGVANPNDWFLTPTEENILASMMSNATLNVTGDDDPKASERSKVEQPIVDIGRQKLEDRVAEANRRSDKQQPNDPYGELRKAKRQRRRERREQKSQAKKQGKEKESHDRQFWMEQHQMQIASYQRHFHMEQQQKEMDSYERQYQPEFDRSGRSLASELFRNAQNLERQPWLGGWNPIQIEPLRRSERLEHQKEVEKAGGLEMFQATNMMDNMDIKME